MARLNLVVFCVLSSLLLLAQEPTPSTPTFDYEIARSHELPPHRRTIPHVGVKPGFNQLRVTVTVSPTGNVVDANAQGDQAALEFWPELQSEILQWQFTPFEKDGNPVTAEVEEYIDLVPPERLPTAHVTPPELKANSKISITLQRTGCLGTCPSYSVTISNSGVVFEGGADVVANGKHIASVDPDDVRGLVRKFISADFFSMDDRYRASVTDNPSYTIAITIDGHSKTVEDYVGAWVGMPGVISELEEDVDSVAGTNRWIQGDDGLVDALQAEKFNFRSFEAQLMLKAAARRGKTATVRELLKAGTPLEAMPAPKPKEPYVAVPLEHVGWLAAASRNPDTVQALMEAGASKDDQADKNLALAGAASSGNVDTARALIAYGASPNANLKKLTFTENGPDMFIEEEGAESILIYAAHSGNPEMVREILKYHPKLEAKDREGKTAIFAAGDYRYNDKDGARVECVRLLARAGANVNARDKDGNTPLHEIFLTDVEEELLKLGADVNARNNDGETPIFTNNASIALLIRNGADLTIRNNKGQSVIEVAKGKGGPDREEALRKALQQSTQQ